MKLSKGIKVKMKREIAECLDQLISGLLALEWHDDDDKLMVSSLVEIKGRLYQKMGHWQLVYQMELTPAQAIALRILFNDFVDNQKQTPNTQYLFNWLQQVAMDVHKQYS